MKKTLITFALFASILLTTAPVAMAASLDFVTGGLADFNFDDSPGSNNLAPLVVWGAVAAAVAIIVIIIIIIGVGGSGGGGPVSNCYESCYNAGGSSFECDNQCLGG